MKFKYKGANDSGKYVTGEVEAPDERVAAAIVREQKLTPISITEQKSIINFNDIAGKFGGVSSAEITNFTRQLSTMVTAGLPLTDALSLLKSQSSPKLSLVVGGVLQDVQGGVSLSESMSKHPEVFSKVYVALVRAGESAGVMDTILNRLADSMEKSREFVSKVKGAMVYPVIVLLGMVLVMIIMMVAVVPKLTTLYGEFKTDLPLATKLVIGMSNFMVNFWWLGIAMVVGGVLGFQTYAKTSAGRRQIDSLLYKIPVAGPLLKEVMLTELTRTTALLVSAGVSIVDALNIVAGAVGNVVMEVEVRRVARQVEKGFPVSVCFTESGMFPPILGQMAAVGEETGKMDEVLEKLSHYYESESEEKVKGLTTALEPIIIVVLGGSVGFLVFSIIMPIYEITNKI